MYSRTDDIFKYGDKLLWRITERVDYKYTKKGIIWDSEEMDWYWSSIILKYDPINEEWKIWENTPRLPEGLKIEKFSVLPNSNIAMIFCEYDYSYKNNKKNRR